MLDVHLDDFFKHISTALLLGLQRFPAPFTLFVEDISGPDDMDEFGLHSPQHLAALGAIQWLKDEDFARFGARDGQISVDDFVLTSKAFSRLLKQTDETVLFNALEKALTERDSGKLRTLVQAHILGK
ncbi:MAG: hypothetical protein P1U57_10600 [Oleibacter sp.]|nr:hypothetical protein [Thalassolituus sp.]